MATIFGSHFATSRLLSILGFWFWCLNIHFRISKTIERNYTRNWTSVLNVRRECFGKPPSTIWFLISVVGGNACLVIISWLSSISLIVRVLWSRVTLSSAWVLMSWLCRRVRSAINLPLVDTICDNRSQRLCLRLVIALVYRVRTPLLHVDGCYLWLKVWIHTVSEPTIKYNSCFFLLVITMSAKQ